MKILFVYGFFSHGGCETVLYTRQSALLRRGVECHVLFMAPADANVFNAGTGMYFSNDAGEILALLRREDYTVVAVLDCPAFYPLLAAAGFRGTVVAECHTSNTEYLRYITELPLYHYPDAFIVPSPVQALTLRKIYQIQAPVYVLPNGIDCSLFDYRNVSPAGWPAATPAHSRILGWVGRLEAAKNPLFFLRLAQSLRKEDQNLQFWLAGGKDFSPLLHQVKATAVSLGLQEHFRWFPAIPYRRMPEFYSRLARSGGCLISTSERECYPMILLEAAACRCPIAATDIAGNRAVITSGYDGLLYPAGDLTAAARSVAALLNDGKLRERIIAAAYFRTRTDNSAERMAGRLLELYRTILAPRKDREDTD
ncbi:MAG: glycosyltransferase family 4 protein [bacterium]|jgi:glycosyltransferase involved in cell wall biosynthesis